MNLTNYQVTDVLPSMSFIRGRSRQSVAVEKEESEIIGLIPMTVLEGLVGVSSEVPFPFRSARSSNRGF